MRQLGCVGDADLYPVGIGAQEIISEGYIINTLGRILAFALDPLFHRFGLFLLTGVGALQGLWTALYNAPLVPYTNFSNSVLMGSLVFSLLAFYPVYWGGRVMVVKYRETVMERLNRLKIVHAFRASSLYKWYSRYSKLRMG